MKKNLLFIMLIFSINSKLNAQTWANPGATWYYSNNTTFYIGYYKIEKIGDTLINSFNCDNYLTTELIFNGSFNTIYNHEYTYQSNDTVYRWFDNQFVIFAIYNSSIGDTWSFPVDSSSCTSSGFFQVDSIGQTIINNDTLSVRYLTMVLPNLGSSQVTLTEKIGYSHTMFPYWSCTVDFYMPGPFRCYSDSSGFLYSSNIAPYCDFTTAISENSPDNRFIQIFPNPANDFCTINIEKLKNGTLILYDLMGRIILEENFNSQSSISLENFKEGTYLVKVIDEKGFTFRDKIIKK
jgi:hypothetical protein